MKGFPVHRHLKMLMTLEKSSVQTLAPGLATDGFHLESVTRLPKSFELRPMTTQTDGNVPFFVWASLSSGGEADLRRTDIAGFRRGCRLHQ